MYRIAIVFGFSESCYEMVRQLIVSCCRAAKLSNLDASYHFIAYECNYNIAQETCEPFKEECDLSKGIPIDSEIKQISDFTWASPLPDISVYHDFATKYLDDYDYALFCHDDIYLKLHPVFRDVVHVINETNIDLIAESSATCLRDLSVRFRPSFIFVRTDKFRKADLSFVNDYHILHDDMKAYSIRIDGGAGLLASYYRSDNPTESTPCTKFPTTWFKHLRFDTDYGVEFYNLRNPHSSQFGNLMGKAKRYADYHLYGQHPSQ